MNYILEGITDLLPSKQGNLLNLLVNISFISLYNRHANEIENSSANMTSIFTRHVEEMELFQATWQSDLLQTQQTQREEYREFVIELYREYQSRLANMSDEQRDALIVDKKLDGKELVEIAASRVKCWEHPEQGIPKL